MRPRGELWALWRGAAPGQPGRGAGRGPGGHGGRERCVGRRRRRGKAAAGRHGSPRCYKGPGAAAPHISLARSHSGRSSSSSSSSIAAGQHQMGMGTALAARLGLGLLLLALLLPTQVSPGAAGRLPPQGETLGRGGFLPRGPPWCVPSRSPAGGGRDGRARAAPAAGGRGWAGAGGGASPEPWDRRAGAVHYPAQSKKDQVGVRRFFGSFFVSVFPWDPRGEAAAPRCERQLSAHSPAG